MNVPKHLFWYVLLWACLIWYASLLLYVGWKGFGDIRRMIRGLRDKNKADA